MGTPASLLRKCGTISCIWVGDVTDFRMWPLMSLSNIRHLMASQMGLASEDGQLMGHVFRKARDLGLHGERTWFQGTYACQKCLRFR